MVDRRGPAYRLRLGRERGAPSKRQLEVARYLSRGLTLGMTADAMFLSRHTVACHAADLRYRLGSKNTLHAVCECIRQGLID